MMQKTTVIVFLAVFFLSFDISHEAFAYLDPGTGSMVLQLLLGGVAGMIMVMKLYWQRIKGFLKRK